MSSSEQGFPGYVAETNASGAALYAFVIVYTTLSLLLIAPLVVFGRRNEKRQAVWRDAHASNQGPEQTVGLGQQPPLIQEPPLQGSQPTNAFRPSEPEVQSEQGRPTAASRQVSEADIHSEPVQVGNGVHPRNIQGGVLRKLDRYATSSYPDDFILSAISGSARTRAQDSSVGGSRDRQSSTPSAATTSRLYRRATQQQPQTRVWDVHGRRWKARRPIGRADTIHHAIQTESQVQAASTAHSQTACRNTSGRVTPPVYRDDTARVLSSGRGNVVVNQNAVRSRRRNRIRGGSFSSAESGSILLPPLVDDITPNDAADAGDPGRESPFENGETEEVTVFCGPNALWKPRILVKAIDVIADLANPDSEMKRILALELPLTLGAISSSVFQLIIVAVVSHSIGTDSMAAFILTSLFLGLSDDLVGAIADAEGTLCSHALSMGDMHLTGQYVQLAVCYHLIVFGSIMVVWVCFIDSVVEWMVASPTIAAIALSYTRISVFQHLLSTLSRTVSVLFHLVGSENFESQVDLFEGLFTVVVVACVLPSFSGATLNSVGWIQLTAAIGAFVVKLVHAATRGWPPLFWRGLIRDGAFRNTNAVKQLVVGSLPLFIGAFLEYSEWELLIVFVVNLGQAEVVAWALLGVVWNVLEASTEGIGEAAAVRVAYHLGTGNPNKAMLSSYKSCFVAVVQALLATSVLFMIGKNLATWLTTDVTLQNMVNDVIPLVGLGNIIMSYALICWNLVGAQGRYRLATSVILLSRWLVTVPIAAVFAYALTLDLSGTMASLIVGFDTASMALAYVLLRSDWKRLSHTMQDISAIGDVEGGDESDHEQEGELDGLRGTKEEDD